MLATAFFLLLTGIFCLYEQEAGVFDWHQEHVGPVSNRGCVAYSQRSIIVGSEVGIVAQISLKSSEIEWRQSIGGNASIVKVVLVGSNSYAICKSASQWTLYGFSNQDQGAYIFSQGIDVKDDTLVTLVSKDGSIYAVFSSSVYRFDTRNGSPLFKYQIPEKGIIGNALFKEDAVYLLYSISSRLRITILDMKGKFLSESEYLDSHLLGSRIDILGTNRNYYAIFTSPDGPQVTKIDDKSMQIASLSNLVGYKCGLPSGLSVDRLFLDYFAVESSESSAIEIFKMSEDFTVSLVHKFDIAMDVSFIQFGHITEDVVAFTLVSSDNEKTIQSQTVIIDAGTSDASFHCIKDSAKHWTLEESLTESTCSLFVDKDNFHTEAKPGLETDDTVLSRIENRIRRHSSQLMAYLSTFLKSSSKMKKSAKYGFEKIVVFASKRGKLVAIETDSGRILWERMFPALSPTSMFLVRGHSNAILTLVASSNLKRDSTHALQLYLASGGNVEGVTELVLPKRMHATLTKIRHQATSVYTVALMDSEGSLALFPSSKDVMNSFSREKRRFYYYTTSGIRGNSIQGLVASKKHDKTFFKAHLMWNLTLQEHETIAAIAVPDASPVASLGRVLGDRSVLYKYLNPNVVSFISIKKANDSVSILNLYLIDAITGNILLKHSRKDAGGMEAGLVHLKMQENFIVYTYWNGGHEKSPKQNEISIVELYESAHPDVKTIDVNVSSFQVSRLAALEQSYVLSYPVSSIGITSTLAGVTSKEVLVAYRNGMIQGFSRRLLDPRRPTKAMSSSEKEEGLIPYHPALSVNYHDVATYFKPVLGIKHAKTLPTNLESTSVILAYGLDIFSTRRMPSKPFDTLSEDFSYLQLILSIVALSMGVYYTGKQVQHKRIKESWL